MSLCAINQVLIKYIFLGIIQGVTEFFPVSSSAHLVIFQQLLQIQENQILLGIVLHLGTLLALIVFLFRDIKQQLNKKIIAYLSLATALTAVVVIFGQGFFESMFFSARRLAFPLFTTGIILLCTKRFGQRAQRNFADLKITDALLLGIVQGFCVIPGLSRSGLTISTLLFRNVQKETALKFSLLASIPAILGALFFKINDFSHLSFFEFRYMALGFLFSFFSSLLALKILLVVIRKTRFHLFGYYCLALALVLWRWLI